MDRRAVRLALGLTIAGASMLATGVVTWAITAVGGAASGLATRDLRLAALALLAGGTACGLAMGFALGAPGRSQAGRLRVPAEAGRLTPEVRGSVPVPSLAEPRSLMNPPPPSPPPLPPPRLAPPSPFGTQPTGRLSSGDVPSGDVPSGDAPSGDAPSGDAPSGDAPSGDAPSGDPRPTPRVWWRAAHSPASNWDDTSEEWLRSLRGPAIQQPPPHSTE
jgi:hypothetical protein